jgi:hypothetical protein
MRSVTLVYILQCYDIAIDQDHWGCLLMFSTLVELLHHLLLMWWWFQTNGSALQTRVELTRVKLTRWEVIRTQVFDPCWWCLSLLVLHHSLSIRGLFQPLLGWHLCTNSILNVDLEISRLCMFHKREWWWYMISKGWLLQRWGLYVTLITEERIF